MKRYSNMKAKDKENLRERAYFSYLLTALSSMFKWTVPKGVEQKYLEQFLHCSGSFGVQKINGEYAVVENPSRADKLNQYGDGMEVYGVNIKYQIRGTIDKDVLVCYNNIDRTPDFDMIRYTDGFSQIDKAIMANVRWSILAPILCASDDKTAFAINKLVDDMLSGKIKCITSEDVLKSLSGNNSNGAYSIDITHPERIKNVQYQSELYDVLMRRFFNKYGLNIQNSSKHAQASVDEVHGLDCVSWVLPLDMYRQRKEFCDKASKLWGDEWNVDFNEPWKSELRKYEAETEKQEIENEVQQPNTDDNTAIDDILDNEPINEKGEIVNDEQELD